MDITPEKWKELREARGLTQMELASVAGLSSQAVVSNVERGLRPGPAVERRLREALGLLRDDAPREQMTTVTTDA